MYKLSGKASPPNVLQTFDLNTKAKKNFVHLIPIKNWLNVNQRFNVSWKFDAEDKTVFINAANTLDVAGDSSKDYKLSIYALKACNAKFTLFFKNPNTHEFISYRVVNIKSNIESNSNSSRSNVNNLAFKPRPINNTQTHNIIKSPSPPSLDKEINDGSLK